MDVFNLYFSTGNVVVLKYQNKKSARGGYEWKAMETPQPHFDKETFEKIADKHDFIIDEKGNKITDEEPQAISSEEKRASFKKLELSFYGFLARECK